MSSEMSISMEIVHYFFFPSFILSKQAKASFCISPKIMYVLFSSCDLVQLALVLYIIFFFLSHAMATNRSVFRSLIIIFTAKLPDRSVVNSAQLSDVRGNYFRIFAFIQIKEMCALVSIAFLLFGLNLVGDSLCVAHLNVRRNAVPLARRQANR